MSTLPNQVSPGDLITAELMNLILTELNSLDSRVSALEASGVSNGQRPAVGFIHVGWQSSPRGLNLVPGDPQPFPHVFSIVNNTDTKLPIQLGAVVTAANGTWTNAVQIFDSGGNQINFVPLASGASQHVSVAITVPNDAKINDVATLTLNATVGPPHNKQDSAQLQLTVAASAGGAVVRNVQLSRIVPPPNPDNVDPSSILTYGVDLSYAATTAPLTENFTFSAILSVDAAHNLNDWFLDFNGASRNNPSAGVFTTPVTLVANAAVSPKVLINIRAPLARTGTDNVLSITFRIDSTDLTPSISQQSNPFTLTLKHV